MPNSPSTGAPMEKNNPGWHLACEAAVSSAGRRDQCSPDAGVVKGHVFFWNWSSGLWFFTKKNWDCTNQNGDFLGCSNLAEIRELAMDVSRLWGNHFFWFINGWFSIAMLDGFSFLEWTLMWFNWFNDYHELQWVWPFENQTWLQNPATKWRFNGKII